MYSGIILAIGCPPLATAAAAVSQAVGQVINVHKNAVTRLGSGNIGKLYSNIVSSNPQVEKKLVADNIKTGDSAFSTLPSNVEVARIAYEEDQMSNPADIQENIIGGIREELRWLRDVNEIQNFFLVPEIGSLERDFR